MGFYDQRIEFRGTKEMKIHLMSMENHSDYLRNLIDQDRLAKADPEFIKLKKRELQDQLKALNELGKHSTDNQDKVNSILNREYESFKQNNRMMTEDRFNWRWIEDKIIPQLKRLGCKLDKKEILVIFQDNYREGKVLIGV